MKNVKIWRVKGYSGYYDCDGESDYNINRAFAMDSCFSEKQVIEFLMSYYKARVVTLVVKLEKELAIDEGE